MTQLTDLQDAVAELNTSVSAQLAAIATEIEQLAAASGAVVDLSGPIDSLRALKAQIDDSTARLAADDA